MLLHAELNPDVWSAADCVSAVLPEQHTQAQVSRNGLQIYPELLKRFVLTVAHACLRSTKLTKFMTAVHWSHREGWIS
jgi:hypothetical protein